VLWMTHDVLSLMISIDKVCGFLLHSIQLSGAAQGALLMF